MAVTSALTVSDVDDTNIESAVIQITGNFTLGQDVLAFADTANITGSWDSGTGMLTLSGSDTLANYQAALRSVTYQNTSDNPSIATRTVRFTVHDGDANSNTQTRDITIRAVNDPPVLDLDADDSSGSGGADFATTFTEDLGPVAIADVDATLLDVDDANLTALTVTITNLLDGASEVLAANTSGTSITASYDSGTGVLSLTGSDTVAHYQQVLLTVSYHNSSLAPTTANRLIEFMAQDGTEYSGVATTTLVVQGQNDPPLATAESYSVDNHDMLIVVAPGLLNNDTDVDGDPLRVVLVTGVANGTLTINPDGSFAYTPRISFFGTDRFTYKVNDGTADSSATTVAIEVIPAVGPPPPPATRSLSPSSRRVAQVEDQNHAGNPVEPPGVWPQDHADGHQPASSATSDGDSVDQNVERRPAAAAVLRPRSSLELEMDEEQSSLCDGYSGFHDGALMEQTASVSVVGSTSPRSRPTAAKVVSYGNSNVPDTERLWREPDWLCEATEVTELSTELISIGWVTVLTAVLTTSYGFWVLYVSYLPESSARSMPVWQAFDPWPILDARSGRLERAMGEDSLQTLARKADSESAKV